MTASPTDDLASAERAIQELTKELSQARGELVEAREQQATTAKILSVISGSRGELHRVFAALAVDAARLCDAFDAAIYQVDGEVLRVVAHHGPIDIGIVGDFTLPLTRDIALGRAVIERGSLHIADLQAEGKEYPEGRDYALRWNFHTQLAVPLRSAGDSLGVIVIRSAEVRPFTDGQVELLAQLRRSSCHRHREHAAVRGGAGAQSRIAGSPGTADCDESDLKCDQPLPNRCAARFRSDRRERSASLRG